MYPYFLRVHQLFQINKQQHFQLVVVLPLFEQMDVLIAFYILAFDFHLYSSYINKKYQIRSRLQVKVYFTYHVFTKSLQSFERRSTSSRNGGPSTICCN